MTSIKAIVVEDSRLAREGLIRMLEEYPGLDLAGDADSAQVAVKLIEQKRPELLFLDVHMPGESGFELLEMLDYEPKIIFTTAYSDYAIRSFDYNTVDYLLKPIRKDRLDEAIRKLSLDSAAVAEPQKSDDRLDFDSRIFVKDGNKCHLIEVSTIDYIESCKNYAVLHFNGETAFVKKSLNQVEVRLPDKLFFRVNRKHIVNLKAIKGIEISINDNYELTLADGNTTEVSRRNSTRLKELLSL